MYGVISFKDDSQLERRMNSSLSSAIHYCFNTVRYAEIYNKRKNSDESKPVGHISLVQTGNQMTLSGSGEIYEQFKAWGFLQNLSGIATEPVSFFQDGYKNAPVRAIKFDETYYDMHYDVRSSKEWLVLNVNLWIFQLEWHKISQHLLYIFFHSHLLQMFSSIRIDFLFRVEEMIKVSLIIFKKLSSYKWYLSS